MRDGVRTVLALLVVLAIAGCGGQQLPKGNYGAVHGIVKSTSGSPIAGATITIDTVLTGVTAADGSYTIGTVPADDANTSTSVYCSASGYSSPPAQSIKVTADQTTEADFTLSPM